MTTYRTANIIFSKFSRDYMGLKKDLPIRQSEMGVLNIIIQRAGDFTPLAIAELLGVSKPMVAAHIAVLEKKGYIYKEASGTDKRSFFIRPTEKGKDLANHAEAALNRHLQRIEAALGKERFADLLTLLGEAQNVLNEASNVKTERLWIRPLAAKDWQAMQAIAADFGASPYAVYDMPLPTETPKIKALTQKFSETKLFFAVELAGVMIGYICFHPESDEYDLGFCFHSDYHGKGYAFESCSALMEQLAKEKGVKGFTAGTALKNAPACKLLQRLGFTLKGTERLSFHKDENGNDIIFEGGIFRKETENHTTQ